MQTIYMIIPGRDETEGVISFSRDDNGYLVWSARWEYVYCTDQNGDRTVQAEFTTDTLDKASNWLHDTM